MNLLNEERDSKFVTRKWNIINDQPSTSYDPGNEIVYNKEVLKSNVCDFIDAYILVRGGITIVGDNGVRIAFKNCVPFIKSITKIDETTIDDTEYLDLVMPINNLLEYSSNYSETKESS